VALDAITHQQSTFTRATWRCSRTGTATASTSSTRSWARCAARPIWSLGQDDRGEDRFTTRDMIEAEQRLHRAAE
jgi:hypothetical protein